MSKKVTVIQVDDYQAVYVGNELYKQGSDIVVHDEYELGSLFEAMDLDVDLEVVSDTAYDEYFEENGSFPETWKEASRISKD